MAKIIDIYKNAREPVFSLEFFPPKTAEGEEKLFQTVEELKAIGPEFVSVTYGAGGSTREKTFEITEKIIKNYGLTAASHFTSVGSTKDDITRYLDEMQSRGIENIMALRGDPPAGAKTFDASLSAFPHASDMISFIRESGYDFGMGGACYPEKHPEAKSLEDDVESLRTKVAAGAEFLVTQLFFENQVFYDFISIVKKKGIGVPVVPGIMPITSFSQIARFREMAGCSIPDGFVAELEKVKDDKGRFLAASMEYTVKQCMDLLNQGVPGIHFYTLNQSGATLGILKEIKGRLVKK